MTDASNADHAIFCVLCDLIAALYPDPADHHTVRSEAINRLRLVRRDGWDGLTGRVAALGASLAPSTGSPGRVGADEATEAPAGVIRDNGVPASGKPHRSGDPIPHVRIPERY